MAAIHNWMKGLEPDRKLVELCLPGSHDAGVYRDLRPPFRGHTQVANPGSMTRCQYANIWEQAMCGSRVFDIRVFLRREWDPSNKTETRTRETPTMGHFFRETIHGTVGEFGGTLMSALDHAARFLEAYPSEFLIFRIGHTKCTQEVAQVLKDFRTAPKNEDESAAYAKHRQGVVYTGATGNLADLEYQQLKGKLLLVFDNQFMSSAAGWPAVPLVQDTSIPANTRYQMQDQLKAAGLSDQEIATITTADAQAKLGQPNPFSSVYGYYPYDKYPYIPLIGLTFCGEYAGGLGDKALHKGNWTAESADLLGHNGCEEHQKHKSKSHHLLWVYWQQTGDNIWENTTAPQGMRARLEKFLNDLSTNGKFARPNVIGHDFVTKETCAKIVKLNPDLKDTSFIGVDVFIRP